MAKISALTELAAADLATDDVLVIVDTDGSATKKIEVQNIDRAFTTTFTRTILDDANAAAVIATLGLDADIATFAVPASTTISAYGKTLVDDADAETALKTLLLRRSKLTINDATAATEIKCQVSSLWNGDSDGPTDNIGKGETVGNYSLNAGGSGLTIEAAALSGNVTAILSAVITKNAGGTLAAVGTAVTANDIVLSFTNGTSGAALDLTTVMDVGEPIEVNLTYTTDA
jgi:hypothetical protein